MRYPEFLKPGGTIGFIAPSFGCATEPYASAFSNAVRTFGEMGYRIAEGPNTRLACGIGKSNTPKACGNEINDFFLNNRSDVIISCGGGETMCEDLPFVDFKRISTAKPKWFMGYSDNTNLTFLLPTLCDTAAIYGPCAAEFGSEPWHEAVNDAYELLLGAKLDFTNYDGWEKTSVKDESNPYASYNITEKYAQTLAGNTGKASNFSGRLLGGCLDCLVNLCGTRFDRVKDFNEKYKEDGTIWFLESCDLGAVGIRRALWQLEQAGWFDTVKGFIIGRPYRYDDEFDGFTPKDAAVGILEKYNVPIVLDADLGHLPPKIPVITGAKADISAASNTLRINVKLV